MTNEPIISVIIPVYNTEEYLPRCLDSILNNTYKNLQVICVNDGSVDNSLRILNEYASKDSRVLVIDKENEGVSVARNVGLEYAQGEYISFIDSDDWIHNNYFELLYKESIKNSVDVICCDNEIVNTSNIYIYIYIYIYITNAILVTIQLMLLIKMTIIFVETALVINYIKWNVLKI